MSRVLRISEGYVNPPFPRRESRLAEQSERYLKAFTYAEEYGIFDLITYPLYCADTLIRLGYEPFPPIENRSLLNFYSPLLVLPGVIPYSRYLLFTADGIEIYQSFIPHLAKKLVSVKLLRTLEAKIPIPQPHGEQMPMPSLFEIFTHENVTHYLLMKARVLACKLAVTVASHPFHVISVRCIASFVGTQEGYRTPLACILSTWRSEGIMGFFNGLWPRLIADFIFVTTSSVLYLSIVKSIQNVSHQMDDRALDLVETSTLLFSNYVGNNYSNQFRNVSDLMAINGSELLLGNLPFTPLYFNWFDCWRNLRSDRLYLSPSYISFSRVYSGTRIALDGRMVALDKFGPLYMPKEGVKVPYLLTDYYSAVLSDEFVRQSLSFDMNLENEKNERANRLVSSLINVHT